MSLRRGQIKEFVAEVKRPSLGSLLVALALVAVQLVLLQYLLSPGRVADLDETSVLVNETDNFTHAALAALKSQAIQGGLKVFAIGGSSIRECFFEDDRMSGLLSQTLGRKVTFVNLATFDQSIVETLILVFSLTLDSESVVIVGINPRFLSSGPEVARTYCSGGRLPFVVQASKRMIAANIDAGPCSWPLPAAYLERAYIRRFMDSRLEFPFLKRLLAFIKGEKGFPPLKDFWRFRQVDFYLPHPFPDSPLPVPEKKKMAYRIRTEYLDRFRENHGFAFSLFEAVLDHVSGNGAQVVLLESPRSEISYQAYRPIMDVYRQDLNRVLAETALPYVRFPRRAMFSEDDFHDLDHLHSGGRRKYVPWFVEKFKELLRGEALKKE